MTEFLLGFIAGMVSCCLIGMALSADEPTALDVYRNNTTLEITYRDGMPIDTVVVYKSRLK
jgi:hypothetical protein